MIFSWFVMRGFKSLAVGSVDEKNAKRAAQAIIDGAIPSVAKLYGADRIVVMCPDGKLACRILVEAA